MEKIRIQTTESSNISQALGISEERFNQMIEIIESEFNSEGEEGRLTDVAKRAIDKLNPNLNELFYIGIMFGEVVERNGQTRPGPTPEEIMSALFRSAAQN